MGAPSPGRVATVSAFWTLPGEAGYCPCARAMTRAALSDVPRVAEDAELVVAELFSNGCRHTRSGEAGGSIDLSVNLLADGLTLVSVADEGPPWSAPGLRPLLPALPPSSPLRTGLRGLRLVASVSDEWGCDGNERGGHTVWAAFRP
ncbi:ATP-binding protein [Nocardiopsis composta]|uniref:Anti-sigma regulatory factor (Ser/Thr protein kinase) n=1 Tax=Nocardiopsis composta TaxID=157465 RepID=A0A7W8QSE2_9ACTN|nr:ATP-binding protein [Nocardiopsis composta]MBB5435033.1 anti-sigma regulatory factor (Ser/Thr protein kinase) [Nocardiopsis composta]